MLHNLTTSCIDVELHNILGQLTMTFLDCPRTAVQKSFFCPQSRVSILFSLVISRPSSFNAVKVPVYEQVQSKVQEKAEQEDRLASFLRT